MKNIKIGDKLEIHSYKHDGSIHRSWDEAVVLEIRKDLLIVGNNKTLVTESDGRKWKTKEPAVIYFFKNNWFNIIGQLKKKGIYYYCNIASPFIIDGNVIKYIDYDLDLRVFPDFNYKVLDKNEYKYHRRILNYSDNLDKILHVELDELIKCVENRKYAFVHNVIKDYNSLYEKYKIKA